MKPRVAIVIEIFAGPGEKGYSRFRSIAETFVAGGYDVDVLCSTFVHADKSKRPRGYFEAMELPYRVVEFDEPGYEKNISLRRIYSQYRFAHRLKRYFAGAGGCYDCVYSTMPDNYVAAVACAYAKREGIPIVIDVEDLLPEGFKQVFSVPVVSDALFALWGATAEWVYRRVDGVVGSSDEYRDRPFKHAHRDIPRETVYVGIDLAAFDEGAARNTSAFRKPADEFWVTYTGTLGTSYDLQTPLQAVSMLRERGAKNVVLKIAGDGPLRAQLEAHAAQLPACRAEFLGYLDYGRMAALLVSSDVALNSFGPAATQSIVNKVGDYFGGGVPVLNSCPSPEFRLLVEREGVGITVAPGCPEETCLALDMLHSNAALRQTMGRNARALAERSFDRAASYPAIVALMDGLLSRCQR